MTTAGEFKAGLRGQLLSPGDEGYDGARRLWNGMFDRRPALIARCAGAADVIRAVSFARDNRLAVAVRGGGHSFPGHSVCDGGLVIDLSAMKAIRVDLRTLTARRGKVDRVRPRDPGLIRGALRSRRRGPRHRLASQPPPAAST